MVKEILIPKGFKPGEPYTTTPLRPYYDPEELVAALDKPEDGDLGELSLETAKVTAEADVETDEDARFAAAVDAQEGVESAPELEGGRRRVDHETSQRQLHNLAHFEIFRHLDAVEKLKRLLFDSYNFPTSRFNLQAIKQEWHKC